VPERVPDAICEIRNRMDVGDTAGKRVVSTGCDILELDGDLIRNERAYFDLEGLKLRG